MSRISKRVSIRIGRGISVEEIEEMLDTCVAEESTRFLRGAKAGVSPIPSQSL